MADHLQAMFVKPVGVDQAPIEVSLLIHFIEGLALISFMHRYLKTNVNQAQSRQSIIIITPPVNLPLCSILNESHDTNSNKLWRQRG